MRSIACTRPLKRRRDAEGCSRSISIQIAVRYRPQGATCDVSMACGPGTFTSQHVTFGALGDSWYEYLLKTYLLRGQAPPDERLWKMCVAEPRTGLVRMYCGTCWIAGNRYTDAMAATMDQLVKKSTPSGLTYIAEHNGAQRGTWCCSCAPAD